MLVEFTTRLHAARDLTDDEVRLAVAHLADEAVPAEPKAEFLTALAVKGETPGEIAAFARELAARAIRPELDVATRAREILDVVGTGGDRHGTFNISTTAALVCAAAGVTVAKHGNRSVTSRCGSADVLEALGVRIDLPPDAAAQSLREHGFAFFFAPQYHPAFRHVAAARRLCAERGQRTLFNFLGPLLNPARPSAQLVGVSRPELCEPIARVLQLLGVRRAMVVSGSVASSESGVSGSRPGKDAPAAGATWLDELSTLGDNTLAEFYQERGFATSVLSPDRFPVLPARLADLLGSDRHANAEIIRRLFRGQDRGPKRDAVLLNAAAALFVAGRVRALSEGWDLAAEILDSGQAHAKLAELIRV